MELEIICQQCSSIAYNGGSDYEAYVCFNCGWEMSWDRYNEADRERQEHP